MHWIGNILIKCLTCRDDLRMIFLLCSHIPILYLSIMLVLNMLVYLAVDIHKNPGPALFVTSIPEVSIHMHACTSWKILDIERVGCLRKDLIVRSRVTCRPSDSRGDVVRINLAFLVCIFYTGYCQCLGIIACVWHVYNLRRVLPLFCEREVGYWNGMVQTQFWLKGRGRRRGGRIRGGGETEGEEEKGGGREGGWGGGGGGGDQNKDRQNWI